MDHRKSMVHYSLKMSFQDKIMKDYRSRQLNGRVDNIAKIYKLQLLTKKTWEIGEWITSLLSVNRSIRNEIPQFLNKFIEFQFKFPFSNFHSSCSIRNVNISSGLYWRMMFQVYMEVFSYTAYNLYATPQLCASFSCTLLFTFFCLTNKKRSW